MTTMTITPLELPAKREKDDRPYTLRVNERHQAVLTLLAHTRQDGLTDAEITFTLRMHMAAARRCELRDAGAIQRSETRRNNSWCWTITEAGKRLLDRLNTPNLGAEQ